MATAMAALLLWVQTRSEAGRSFDPTMAPHPAVETVPGDLVVKYRLPPQPLEIGQGGELAALARRRHVLTTEASRLSSSLPISVAASYPLIGMQQLHVTGNESAADVMARLATDQAVELVEPNYKVYAFETQRAVEPNDLAWPTLWGLKQIQAPQAWAHTTGSADVIVAVIDTGIDYRHRDLAPNMWVNPKEPLNGKDDDGNGIVDDIHGARLCGGDAGGDPRDDQGHGTHVAGTIAAAGNNRLDVAGIAWSVKLMALKFLCSDGSGSTADAIRAIEYALERGAHVINASWGGRARSRALEEALREADRWGVLVVAAAGNEGMNTDLVPSYPAGYPLPNILSIAATDWNDDLAEFSNFGIKSVHLGAPGLSILSTMPDNRTAFMNGTSMATPHVAGCAALVKTRHPTWRAPELKQALVASGDSIKRLTGIIQDGRRMNCGRAVQRAGSD